MDHLLRLNQIITDLFFEIVDEFLDGRLSSGDELIDLRLHNLVSQMNVIATEAVQALRAGRDRRIMDWTSHSSPIPRQWPCEYDEFLRLYFSTKEKVQTARNLLARASVDELARCNIFCNSRRELPVISDVVAFLLVLVPTFLLKNLLHWEPTAGISKKILRSASNLGHVGAFLYEDSFSNGSAARTRKHATVTPDEIHSWSDFRGENDQELA